MKFFILLLFPMTAWSNFVASSKINDSNRTVYLRKGLCEQKESESCYRWERDFIPGAVELRQVQVDDLSRPIFSRREKVQSCASEAECTALLPDHCTTDWPEYESKFDRDQMRVYCQRFLGYEQKLSDEPRLVKNDSEHATKVAEREASQQKEASIAQAMRAINCGKRVIAYLVVRNGTKNLTVPQVKSMNEAYSGIKDLLETGSLETAKTEIQAVTADGTLITEDDKSALVAELDSCKPN